MLPPLTWIGPRRMQVEPISVGIGARICRREEAGRLTLPLLRHTACAGADGGPQCHAGLEQVARVDDVPHTDGAGHGN